MHRVIVPSAIWNIYAKYEKYIDQKIRVFALKKENNAEEAICWIVFCAYSFSLLSIKEWWNESIYRFIQDPENAVPIKLTANVTRLLH